MLLQEAKMSEQLKQSPETPKRAESSEEYNKRLEKLTSQKSKEAHHAPKEALDKIKFSIEQEAISSKEYSPAELGENENKSSVVNTKQLRKETLKESLTDIRRHLNKPDRI